MNTNRISVVGRIVVSVIVTLGFFWALFLVVTRNLQGGEVNQILLIMLGGLTTKFGDVVVYWIGSSAGSSEKDAATAANTDKLIHAVSTSSPTGTGGGAVASGQPWWSKLTEEEKAAITALAGTDPRVREFMDKSSAGNATAEELAYVVGLGLLTQDRAAALAG